MPRVPLDKRVYPATRAAGRDVSQTPRGGVAKTHRERGDHQKMVLLGDRTSLRIIFGDRLIFVPEVHLDDFFHVLVEFGELFLHLARLSPYAAIDVAVLVIGKVHNAGEALAKPDGIENREADLSGRSRGKQPKNNIVDRGDSVFRPGLPGLKQHGTFAWIGERQRDCERGRAGQGEPPLVSRCFRKLFKIKV